MKRQLIFLSPDLKQRIWGGAWLKTLFHSDSPDPIGEAWLISGMAEGSAKIVSGPGSSRTLRDYFMSNRSAFSLATSMEFPLLVKIIDAKTKLSVQVHPTDKYAQLKENGSGKTECWYVLEAEEGSTLVLGHRAQTKAELEQMIKEERWHDLLVEKPVHAGDFIFLTSGIIHAIGEGIRLVEIQQPSDLTYRVYDYDRVDASGDKRPLHLNKAIDVAITPAPDVVIKNVASGSSYQQLASSPYFSVDKLNVSGTIDCTLLQNQTLCIIPISGKAEVDGIPVEVGNAIIALPGEAPISINGEAEFLLAYVGKRP